MLIFLGLALVAAAGAWIAWTNRKIEGLLTVYIAELRLQRQLLEMIQRHQVPDAEEEVC